MKDCNFIVASRLKGRASEMGRGAGTGMAMGDPRLTGRGSGNGNDIEAQIEPVLRSSPTAMANFLISH